MNTAEENQRQTVGNTRVGLHGLQRRDGTGHRLVAEEREFQRSVGIGGADESAGCEASKRSVDINEVLTPGTALNKAMTADFDRTAADQAAEHGQTRQRSVQPSLCHHPRQAAQVQGREDQLTRCSVPMKTTTMTVVALTIATMLAFPAAADAQNASASTELPRPPVNTQPHEIKPLFQFAFGPAGLHPHHADHGLHHRTGLWA